MPYGMDAFMLGIGMLGKVLLIEAGSWLTDGTAALKVSWLPPEGSTDQSPCRGRTLESMNGQI